MAEENKQEVAETKKEQKPNIAAMEAELKTLEVEAKKLELKERQANLQDLEERLAERELKRADRGQKAKTNGQSLQSISADQKKAQNRCNHQKGGNGSAGVVGGKGDDSQYAVLKHTFANGDTWVRCLRCGKTWKPVKQSWFATVEEYVKALTEYQTALNFQTRNVPSASIPFRFSDGGDFYREITRDVTLR